MSGMIQGTRVAMMVGVISMSIAVVIGILLGSLAGYYGDTKLKMSRIRIYMNLLFFALGIFYAFMVRSYVLSDAFQQVLVHSLFSCSLVYSCFLFS
jgi:peptide/nickel transport system permease protein